MRQTRLPTFIGIGVVFLVIGLVQQNFELTFESGLFNLGLIFTISGLVAWGLKRTLNAT